MITEVNKYINKQKNIHISNNMLGFQKNRMYVFYNMCHHTRDNRGFVIKTIINEMINKYHFKYDVVFVESDINKIIIEQHKKKSDPVKLRLSQIKANKLFRELIKGGPRKPKI
jgi:hypothetical protein